MSSQAIEQISQTRYSFGFLYIFTICQYVVYYCILFLKKELNAENLKDALAKLIIAQNLPFTHVESETFLELIKLLNPDAERLMVKADAIRDYIMRKSLQIQDIENRISIGRSNCS